MKILSKIVWRYMPGKPHLSIEERIACSYPGDDTPVVWYVAKGCHAKWVPLSMFSDGHPTEILWEILAVPNDDEAAQ